MKISNITAVTRVDGYGQRCIAASIQYSRPIKRSSLKDADFQVRGREIEQIFLADTIFHPEDQNLDEGNYVILILNSEKEEGLLREDIGRGPSGKSYFHKAELAITQRGTIESVTGEICYGSKDYLVSKSTWDEATDKFQFFLHKIPGTERELGYYLYIPEEVKNLGETYPLVLFMHDAGACSTDRIAPLAQGNGGTVWAMEEEQKKHASFVVVPWYPSKCANDEYEVTIEAEDTISLIQELIKTYPIDKSRIYGTGQSMGCMMLCEMNIRYPELFAKSLMIAGQWNPKTMPLCKDKNLWILVSEGDFKAYPIMGNCVDEMEKAGAKVYRGSFSAKEELKSLDHIITQMDLGNENVHFTWFEGKSIIPEGAEENPGLHHILTWALAYDITALRDWLFKESK